MEILNEVYFGKNKNLLQVEELIGEIKDTLTNDEMYNVNKSSQLLKIRQLLAKEFGFEEFRLMINPQGHIENAYTFNFMYSKKVDRDTESLAQVVTSSGIRFKSPKDKRVYCELYSGLIKNYPPATVVGILLHEIGHNFWINTSIIKFAQLNNIMNKYTNMISTVRQLVTKYQLNPIDMAKVVQRLIVIGKGFKDLSNSAFYDEDGKYVANAKNYEELLDYQEKYINRFYTEMVNYSKKYEKAIENYNKKKNSTYFKITTIITRLLSAPFNLLNLLIMPLVLTDSALNNEALIEERTNERFADNFAMSYGYGADISQFFTNKQWLDDYARTQVSFMAKIQAKILWCTFCTQDPHPQAYTRMLFAKKKLEHELANNKNLSPKLKKEIEVELDTIIKMIAESDSKFVEYQKEFEEKYQVEERLDNKLSKYKDTDIFDFTDKVNKKYVDAASTSEVKKEETILKFHESKLDFEIDEFLNSME